MKLEMNNPIHYCFIYMAVVIHVMTLINCTTNKSIIKNQSIEEISNRVFFQYVFAFKEQDIPIYIDPIMKYRSTLFPDKKYGFAHALPNSYLVNPASSDFCKLTIPDTLKGICNYYDSSIDIACDSSVFIFVSPLMPTKKKNIFMMQVSLYSIIREDEEWARFVYHYYTGFKMEGQIIKPVKINTLEEMSIFPMEMIRD